MKRREYGAISPAVPLLILFTAAAVALAGCAIFKRANPLQVTLAGIEPAASGASEDLEARMQLRLRVQNPNDAPIEYDGIYVEIDVQNKSLGSGVSKQSGRCRLLAKPLSACLWNSRIWEWRARR